MVSDDDVRAHEKLSIQLWDSDQVSADDLVGRISVPLEELMLKPNEVTKRKDTLMGFEGKSSPSLAAAARPTLIHRHRCGQPQWHSYVVCRVLQQGQAQLCAQEEGWRRSQLACGAPAASRTRGEHRSSTSFVLPNLIALYTGRSWYLCRH